MEESKYLNFQTLNNQDDQNKAIHQTDTCQENDNKQDIELEEIFLPVVDDYNKEQEKKKEILSKHPSPDMCSRGINTTIKRCNEKKQESNPEFVVGLGGGVEGQKCFLSISKTKKGNLVFILVLVLRQSIKLFCMKFVRMSYFFSINQT